MNKLVQVRQLETQSDHDLVLAVVKINGNVTVNSSVRSRDYRKFKYNDYIMELCGTNWTDLYDLDDPSVMAAGITKKLCKPLNRMAQVKFRIIKTNKKKSLDLVMI